MVTAERVDNRMVDTPRSIKAADRIQKEQEMKRMLIFTVLIIASACGKSSSPSPTAPSTFGAVITVTPAFPTRNEAMTFIAKGRAPQGSIASYMLDFGDGTTFLANTQSETVTAQHVYAAAGTFGVRLTVTNTTGNTVSASGQILVSEQ
jgi:PKD domain-containing protein